MLKTITTDITENYTMTKNLFSPDKYYVAQADGTILYETEDFDEALSVAMPNEIILASYSVVDLSNDYDIKESVKVSKIVIDFNKKLLTLEGGSARIDGVMYDTGDNTLEDEDLKTWDAMIEDAYKATDNVVIIGTPPIEGRNITNEMSDL